VLIGNCASSYFLSHDAQVLFQYYASSFMINLVYLLCNSLKPLA